MPFSREQLEGFNEYWDEKHDYHAQVFRLLDIYNGNLTPYLRDELKAMFKRPDGTISPSYDQAIDRLAPINILQRVIAKQAKIYNRPPKREIPDGDEADKDMLEAYVDGMFMNRQMSIANQMFSLFNCAAVEPAARDGRLLLRPLLNSQFLPWSDDRFDPTNPTVFLVYHGKMKKGDGSEKRVLRAYSDTDFSIFDEDGNQIEEFMNGNPGVNLLGEMPFEYFNRKQQIQLIPTLSDDTYRMSILIPLLLSDVSFALKFQAFSILYGIDVDDQTRPYSPNVMWIFKSQSPETPPSVGTLSPNVDSDKAVKFIQALLAFWLQTKGIRPGSVGQLTTENFTSGISKMIDEMDTFEDRQEQVTYFGPGEERLLDRTLKKFHPIWAAANATPITGAFTDSASIHVTFPEQLPRADRGQLVDVLIKEVDTLKVESRKGALQRLEPELSEKEVEEKLEAIDAERAERAPNMTPGQNPFAPADDAGDDDTEDIEDTDDQ